MDRVNDGQQFLGLICSSKLEGGPPYYASLADGRLLGTFKTFDDAKAAVERGEPKWHRMSVVVEAV